MFRLNPAIMTRIETRFAGLPVRGVLRPAVDVTRDRQIARIH
jgi:hypothetical protein